MAYGTPDRAECERTLHRALDLGVTFLDTANVYGAGHNESLIGEVLGSRRDAFVLATKFGFVLQDGKPGIDGQPDQVAARCDESLARLKTDRIDLYYLHRRDPQVPIEDTVGAMAELVKAGKARAIGLSEVSARTLRRAHAVHPIAAVQSEYSLWTRDPEAHVLPACRELGVGFVPFSPLGRAMLTGRLTKEDLQQQGDMRTGMPRFQGDAFEANLRLVEAIGEMARSKGCQPSQIALSWVLAQGDFIAPIPGTKRVAYLEENVAAAEIALTGPERSKLDALFSPDAVVGERYGAGGLGALIDRD
jgi:aryl-alcohol dehydrogenase-like predicted oxidoreductase